MDSSHNQNLFVVSQRNNMRFGEIFNSLNCQTFFIPTVEGLKYPKLDNSGEGLLYNNGIAEAFCPYHNLLTLSLPTDLNQYFATTLAWEKIEDITKAYINKMRRIISTDRVFISISLIGLKNIITSNDDFSGRVFIDRNELLLNPIVIENINDEETVERALKIQKIDYSLALGIKRSETLSDLIKEIYG